MKYLGPLSSADGSRLFYVDLANQLDTNETLSSISVTCSDIDITISGSGIINSDTTTKDGHILLANQSIYFRAASTASKTVVVQIIIDYNTSNSNKDSTIVYLKVVPTII